MIAAPDAGLSLINSVFQDLKENDHTQENEDVRVLRGPHHGPSPPALTNQNERKIYNKHAERFNCTQRKRKRHYLNLLFFPYDLRSFFLCSIKKNQNAP